MSDIIETLKREQAYLESVKHQMTPLQYGAEAHRIVGAAIRDAEQTVVTAAMAWRYADEDDEDNTALMLERACEELAALRAGLALHLRGGLQHAPEP